MIPRLLLGLVGLALAAPALAAPPALLSDARLASVRGDLSAVLDAAARDGLPEAVLTDKVREGLAKGVAPARILAVVRSLESGLGAARAEASPHLRGGPPSAALLKAIVDAKAAGLAPAVLDRVLAAAGPKGPAPTLRAIEVLTDLAETRYPTGVAAQLVIAVVSHDPRGLEELSARADALTAGGASPTEALLALERAATSGLSLDHAAQLLRDEAPLEGRGPNRETSGPRGPGATGQGRGHGRP